MNIAYTKFMKHAVKVTKEVPGIRPVLKGVHHSENGQVVVTDTHRLYMIGNLPFITSNNIIDPATGKYIEGTYPDTNRLIPCKENAKLRVRLNVKNTLKALDTLVKANIVNASTISTFTVDGVDCALMLRTGNGKECMNVSYKASEYSEGEIEETAFNTKYLLEAFNLFKDIGFEYVDFSAYSPISPFTLTEGDVTALISPVRMP